MGFLWNEKGVSPLLGFILMLMILMISISALQTQYVPSVCEDIEADHMKQITSQLIELKSASTKNLKLDMGVDYPEYLFLMTPESTATTLSVRDFDVSVEYTEILANGSKVEREENFTSSRIEVAPNYLFYPQDRLILENTAVFKHAGANYIPISDQGSFKNKINFMLFNTTIDSVSTTQSLSLISVPQSTGGSVLAENLSISFESVYPQYWKEMEDYNVTVNGDRVTVSEEERTIFSLEKIMLYTGNKRVTGSKPSQMVKTNSMDTFNLKKGESIKLGAKVVDKYNNPMEGVNVTASVSSSIGETNPSVLHTDSEGEVYTTFNAQKAGTGTVTFNCSAIENEVSYDISVTTITSNTSLSISLSSDPAADVDGYSTKTINAYVSSEGDPLPGYNVVFATNSSDAYLNPNETKTSNSGYASVNISQEVGVKGKNWYKVYGYAGSAIDSLDVLLNKSTGEAESPLIDTFKVEEVKQNNPHVEFEVDWAVSDDNGDLNQVEVFMENIETGTINDSAIIDVSGSSALGTTELKDKEAEGSGNTYDFTLTVTDNEGNSNSETKTETES